ncbi:hypothetical protein [Massilia sp. DWR3-1-1]|uniref:hypothetical protein n=1 Tax=Massilia sp. DWR3-1-1 TaxID=2804559 RepID=UPI003CE7C9FF
MDNKNTLSVITYLALAIGFAITTVPPALLFVSDFRHEQATVNIEAEINARIVAQLIHANPELWVFETLRLEELLARRSQHSDNPIHRT